MQFLSFYTRADNRIYASEKASFHSKANEQKRKCG